MYVLRIIQHNSTMRVCIYIYICVYIAPTEGGMHEARKQKQTNKKGGGRREGIYLYNIIICIYTYVCIYIYIYIDIYIYI